MSLRLRDLQQILDKFTNGNKGTSISDCFIYMETDNGQLAEVGKIELQESRLIGKINSSACLLYTSPSPRDGLLSRMPSSA